MPDLSNLILLHDSGTSDMGSLDFLVGTDVNNTARWPIECARASISSLRGHFSGGSGVADLTIRVDSHRGEAFDMTLHTIKGVGTDGIDVNFRVPENQAKHYYVCQGDSVVVTWTNPNTQKWGVELSLEPCDRVATTSREGRNAG